MSKKEIVTATQNVPQVLEGLFGPGTAAESAYINSLESGEIEGTLEDFCGWVIGHTNPDGTFSVNARGGDMPAGLAAAAV